MIRAACAAAVLAACGTIAIGGPVPPGEARRPGPAPPRPPAPAPAPAPGMSASARMAELVNRHRAAAGCPPLALLDGAARAAQGHADDMARRGYFSHVSPEVEGLAERLAREGVRLRMAAENIALDPASPELVLNGWLRSAGHRQNLENCRYTHHGVGERTGRWTHVFVTPAP